MKIMYKRYFESKKVGILYHFTNLDGLFNIKQSDYKLFSSSYSGSLVGSVKKLKYVSFTRNFQMQITNGDNRSTGWRKDLIVRFSIDGNNLSNKYKIQPFLDLENTEKKHGENEEIIISDKVDIKRNIIQIDILNVNSENLEEIVEEINNDYDCFLVEKWKPVK